MIIVSQDKTDVINFDNIVRLSVSPNTSGQFLIEAHNFCDDFETVIGLYETEERAKEVLREIINKYGKYDIDDCNAVTTFPKVYEMPEK